ncbi:DNA endonuclease RBBP8 isoform X1 [Brienomyrus brachyistius]|uniref:DNA endonuclease RBBP8 isoform X1 n=1 Tax=Brienomyrus brachyistius TaxID=42636 RepID=UPI0020B337A3|nr:DNA endonuclease RBBP8 isoform X1 [Brienomyrus brachyistius]XP_048881484.1 DNA endonuclease RBBP8 isoform X1 [Brienomyrus brachyistius]XP_048881490.1 DNA endonuclease RBBP8 isoform X1 [Brienomyrus brachyistius]XP_048881498.1 DNA endonuclease RBBP8 isoform X1 [Brienomyrus brachyistius]XP_048881507.1 DNA endonuclease RBBP8 isoform X1 [Brienomyrus brachyistius]
MSREMNSSGASGGSSPSRPTDVPCDLFRELWMRLKESHDGEVQGLQAKVNKLKKDRCLDAQRLEEFYSKNHQLREHQKALQENVKVLEDRLRAGLCDRCAVTEEHMRKKQVEFEKVRQQNLRLITELMNERNNLQDENRKLGQQLECLRSAGCERAQAEPEEGVIPDSPHHQPVVPTVNRMRRRKENRHVRYAENPELGRGFSSQMPSSCSRADGVLVPETCAMDDSPLKNRCVSHGDGPGVTVVAETCCLDVPDDAESLENISTKENFVKKNENGSRQASTSPDSSSGLERAQNNSPVLERSMKFLKTKDDSSPSVLRTFKLCPLERNLQVNSRNAPFRTGTPSRLSSPNKESGLTSGQDQVAARLLGFDSKKRKLPHNNRAGGVPDKPLDLSDRPSSSCQLEKETEAKDVLMAGQEKPSVTQPKGFNAIQEPEHPEDQEDTVNRSPDQNLHSGPFKVPSAPPFIRTIIQHLLDVKGQTAEEPIRKKSRVGMDSEKMSVLQPNPCARRKSPSRELDEKSSKVVDQTWSLDPGAALSQYATDSPTDTMADPPRLEGETVDTDCTFVSHSMLLKGLNPDEDDPCAGIGQKANDSLEQLFDKTAYGEYESCHLGDGERPQPEEEEEAEESSVDDLPACTTEEEEEVKTAGNHGTRTNASFAHVEVVRKKDERRKLKGHTCKECEIYYADLPEEERQKKLSACSRHRFRYIPPSTPENFWEVGFPSTQTCVERGYIREDNEPEQRMRRRRPYNATFSPKGRGQET